MEYALVPHPSALPTIGISVRARIERQGQRGLQFQFTLEGPVGLVEFGEWSPGGRTDGLWQHTCYEAFLKPVGASGYLELNFRGHEWAAYLFDDYRQGMREAPIEPVADSYGEMYGTDLQNAQVDLGPLEIPGFAGTLEVALSAIIEEKGGQKSYWALAHPPGDEPDFHHPDCFIAKLP